MNAVLYRLSGHENARRTSLLLFGIAFVVRLAGLLIFPETHLSGNAKESIIAGAALIRGGQFVGNADYPMLIPPLTALFTAAIQSLFGDGLLPVKIAQIILDACTVVIVFQIGSRTIGQLPAALGAAFLTVYPFSVFAPLYIGTEALFSFLLAASLLLFTKGISDKAKGLFFASGLILGLATLTRGTTLFLPIFLLAFFVWHERGRTRSAAAIAGKSAMFVLAFMLSLSPWVIRNIVVLDAFIPSSTSHGPMLHGSSERFWLIEDRERELPKYFDHLENEKGIARPASPRPTWVEKDRFYKRAAMEMYKDRWSDDPWSFVPFVAKKFLRLWYGTESGANQGIVIAINLPIYLLAIVGLRSYMRSGSRLGGVLIVLLAYFVVIHVLVFGYFRYMLPVMPYVIIFAAHGCLYLMRRVFRLEFQDIGGNRVASG
jgi:4-amino-4-deoxy-L-arabinose transferase-like glycosyltransferase